MGGVTGASTVHMARERVAVSYSIDYIRIDDTNVFTDNWIAINEKRNADGPCEGNMQTSNRLTAIENIQPRPPDNWHTVHGKLSYTNCVHAQCMHCGNRPMHAA